MSAAFHFARFRSGALAALSAAFLVASPAGAQSSGNSTSMDAQEDAPRGSVPSAPPAANEGWTFVIKPYLWAAAVDGDLTAENLPPAEIELDFGDVLDELEFGFMLGLDAHAGGGSPFGLAFDGMYIDVEDERDFSTTQVRIGLVEADVTYRPCPESRYELLAGARYFSVDSDVNLSGIGSAEDDNEWVDPIVGIRGASLLRDQWSFLWRADVGGFSASSRLTWQAALGLRFEFARGSHFGVGYRHLEIDRDDDIDIDLALTGPIIGLSFGF